MGEKQRGGVQARASARSSWSRRVYLDGTWDFTATQIGGSETFTGTLTIDEERGASRGLTSTGLGAYALTGTRQSE
jgi:hypothetical protein